MKVSATGTTQASMMSNLNILERDFNRHKLWKMDEMLGLMVES